MKKPMIRWLGVGVLCGMLSVAQATIQEDLDAGLSPLEAVQNALEEGVPAEDIAEQLLDAGYDPTSTAELVVNAAPENAALVCKRIVQTAKDGEKLVGDIAAACTRSAPNAAEDIAASLSEVVPEAADDIARITEEAGITEDDIAIITAEEEELTPGQMIAYVQENTPVIEGEVDGSAQIAGLIDTGSTTQDGKTIFIVTDPTTGNPTEWQVIVNEADDNSLIIVDANNNPTNGRIDIINNLPDVVSPN